MMTNLSLSLPNADHRRSGSGPQLWTLADLPTPMRHLFDTIDIATVNPGTDDSHPIQWDDQGSAAAHATQAVAGDRFEFFLNSTLNGHPALHSAVSNSSDHMDLVSDWGGLGEFSIGGNVNTIQACGLTQAGFADMSAAASLVSVRWTPTTAQFYQNGGPIGAQHTGLALPDSGFAMVVLKLFSAGNFGFGRICTLNTIFNRTPAESFGRALHGEAGLLGKASYAPILADVDRIHGFECWRWDIPLVLGHPYESGPPTL